MGRLAQRIAEETGRSQCCHPRNYWLNRNGRSGAWHFRQTTRDGYGEKPRQYVGAARAGNRLSAATAMPVLKSCTCFTAS